MKLVMEFPDKKQEYVCIEDYTIPEPGTEIQHDNKKYYVRRYYILSVTCTDGNLWLLPVLVLDQRL
jgi:hypothetical protein